MAQENKKETKELDTTTTKEVAPKKNFMDILRAIGGYFKGSWQELKLVRWPNRRSTWSMTAAVLIFSGFLCGLIVLLDIGFEALFKLIVK